MSTEVPAPTGSDADKHKDLCLVMSDGTMVESSPEPIEAEAGIQSAAGIAAGVQVFTTMITMRKEKKRANPNHLKCFSTAVHSAGMNAGNIIAFDPDKREYDEITHKVKSRWSMFTSPTFEGKLKVTVFHDRNETMTLDKSIDRSQLNDGLWIPKLEVEYDEIESDVDYDLLYETVEIASIYNPNHLKDAIIIPVVRLILKVKIQTGGWGDDINIKQEFFVDMRKPKGQKISFKEPHMSRS